MDGRVHSSSRWFTTERLEVVGSISVFVGSLGRREWESVSFRFKWVYSGAPRGSANPGTREGSLWHVIWSSRALWFARGLTVVRLGVDGFIRVRVDSLGQA